MRRNVGTANQCLEASGKHCLRHMRCMFNLFFLLMGVKRCCRACDCSEPLCDCAVDVERIAENVKASVSTTIVAPPYISEGTGKKLETLRAPNWYV